MSIESKGYVASIDDIRTLAQKSANAVTTIATTRGVYLRALVFTARSELKNGEAVPAQLAALRAVHSRFYPAVLEAVTTSDIARAPRASSEERHRRALERNRRSNFARSSYSTIRTWLKAGGHSLFSLKPTFTKGQLDAEVPAKEARKVTPEKIKSRVDGLVKRLLEQTRTLAGISPEQGRAVLDEAMNRLAQELFAGAVQATTDANVAAAEHRPLRAGKHVFWPTESQVVRRHRMSKLKVAA